MVIVEFLWLIQWGNQVILSEVNIVLLRSIKKIIKNTYWFESLAEYKNEKSRSDAWFCIKALDV